MEPHENMDEMLPDFLKKNGPKTTGFRLPDGYFENFGDRLSLTPDPSPEEKGAPQEVAGRIPATDAEGLRLSRLSPSGGAGGGFSLPENYFEKLPDRVFEKIGTVGKAVELSQKRPFFNIVKKPAALAAAASMSVLVVALAFFLPAEWEGFNKKEVEKASPIACNVSCLSEKISAEDVEFYLSENLAEFSTDDLATEDLVGEISAPNLKKHQEIDLDADDAEPLLREMLDDFSAEELEDML